MDVLYQTWPLLTLTVVSGTVLVPHREVPIANCTDPLPARYRLTKLMVWLFGPTVNSSASGRLYVYVLPEVAFTWEKMPF